MPVLTAPPVNARPGLAPAGDRGLVERAVVDDALAAAVPETRGSVSAPEDGTAPAHPLAPDRRPRRRPALGTRPPHPRALAALQARRRTDSAPGRTCENQRHRSARRAGPGWRCITRQDPHPPQRRSPGAKGPSAPCLARQDRAPKRQRQANHARHAPFTSEMPVFVRHGTAAPCRTAEQRERPGVSAWICWCARLPPVRTAGMGEDSRSAPHQRSAWPRCLSSSAGGGAALLCR